MVRDVRSNGKDMSSLTPANEALMFSIYYAAITSMDEGDVSRWPIYQFKSSVVLTNASTDHNQLWLE